MSDRAPRGMTASSGRPLTQHCQNVGMDYNAGRGVVLGPYEAFCAELMWFREVVTEAHLPKEYGRNHDSALEVPSVAWQMKRRILEAGLLYGTIDTSAAGPGVVRFIDAALFKNEMLLQPDTWEVHLEDRWQQSPFKRYTRDTGVFDGHILLKSNGIDRSLIKVDAPAVPESVISAVERYLRRVGYERIAGMDIGTYSQTLRSFPWPPVAGMDSMNAALATAGNRAIMAAMGVHGAVERSVEQGVPFFSRDQLAPAWIQTGDADTQFAVVRAALDIPDGPALPGSIKELDGRMSDARVVKLRDFVSWATNRVLTADSTAVREVQKEVQRVSARGSEIRKLEAVTRVVTYIALPIGAAEVLLGASGPGLAFAFTGFLAEGCASILKRFHKGHWMTL